MTPLDGVLVRPPDGPEGPQVWQGTILDDATADDDLVRVSIDNPDAGSQFFDDCRWAPRGVGRPTAGARCIVAVDDDGLPWIVGWDGPITGGGGGGSANTILNGAGAPAGGLGAVGDFYIDTTADAIYGPKLGGGWGSPVSLIGPDGADGAAGPDNVLDGDPVDTTGRSSGMGLVWNGTNWVAQDIATQAELNAVAAAAQPLDAELTALAGLTSAADKLPYFTGSGVAALADLTTFIRTLLDDANAATARATLDVPSNSDLTTRVPDPLPDMATTGDDAKVPRWNDTTDVYDKVAVYSKTEVDFALGGKQTVDSELTALASLTSAADRLPYFTGSGTAALATLTTFIRTLLDDTTAAAAQATLGVPGNTLMDAQGDLYGASANDTPARVPAGSPGQVLAADPNATAGVKWAAGRDFWLPNGALAENMPWTDATTNQAILASGTLRLAGGMILRAGVTYTSITIPAGTTALSAATNQWFCLVDRALNVLRKTADDTSTAWSANATKTLTLSSTYTPTVDIEVYIGVVVVATTPPSLVGPSVQSAMLDLGGGNRRGGASTASLTNPASLGATAGAPSASNVFYGIVS